ncbi:YkvA family protein [Streptosporangium sp. NPDC049644]|uniref:YkvA family protein n=1 Tax=Streptosporangium sp. NPDC049644 TaxID=3155507 RepID=UPI0034157F8A
MNTWVATLLGALTGLVLLWLALVTALAVARPRGNALGEALRLLPDLLRLIPRLARDGSLPRGVRVRLWLLLGYLAMPFDLVPDFVPVLGYADDAIVVALVLRSVVRHSGEAALTRHWPGTAEGLRAVRRLARIPAEPDAGDPETGHRP